MRRARLNIALVVVALGLGVAVFFSQKKEEQGPPLTPLQPADVTRVKLEHPGAAALVLEKRDGRWFLTAPVQAEVDDFEIAALTGMADREAKEKVEGASLAELELDPPKYTLTLNDVAIAVGGVEPLQYRRYVKVGDVVSLVDDPPGAAFDAEYADLVSKNLVPVGAELTRIELPKLTLAQADGKWTVTPADPKAGADAMQKLADGWKNARAMWNEMAKDARVKGDRVRLTLKDGTTREFVVAARDPQLKLHRADQGVTYVLSKALADELFKLPEPKPEAATSEPLTPAGPATVPPAADAAGDDAPKTP